MLGVFFHQIKSLIRSRLAFVIWLQTYYFIDYSKIHRLKGLEPKNKRLSEIDKKICLKYVVLCTVGQYWEKHNFGNPWYFLHLIAKINGFFEIQMYLLHSLIYFLLTVEYMSWKMTVCFYYDDVMAKFMAGRHNKIKLLLLWPLKGL